MSKEEPKEVEVVCGCCGRRDRVNPKTAREWPECCGKVMDRHIDSSGDNPGWSWNDISSMVKIAKYHPDYILWRESLDR